MSEAPPDANEVALARLRYELEHPPFHALFALEAVSVDVEAGEVVVRLPYSPALRRSSDSDDIHGGVLAALIDITAHAAVAVQTGRTAPTVDLRIDYLRRAPGVALQATGRTLRIGRAIARADVEIQAGEFTVAVGRGTFSTLSRA